MPCCFATLLLLVGISSTASSSAPSRVVPSEWVATIAGTVNGTAVFGGRTSKSAAQQAVLVAAASGENTLFRPDLLSIYQFSTAASGRAACQRQQLFSSRVLGLFDFLLAPGTVQNGSAVIRGRGCDVWFSPFGGPYGVTDFLCGVRSKTAAP